MARVNYNVDAKGLLDLYRKLRGDKKATIVSDDTLVLESLFKDELAKIDIELIGITRPYDGSRYFLHMEVPEGVKEPWN